MRLQGLTTSIAAALLIGVAQTFLLITCWAYIAMYTPLPLWLIGQGVSGATLYIVLFVTDFIISVLLSLPAAFLTCKLHPSKPFFYLALAVLPGFLWQYSNVIGDGSLFQDWRYLPGAVSALFMLPVAVLIMQRTNRGRRLTICSSRTCFAPPTTWQIKLAMLLDPLRKSA